MTATEKAQQLVDKYYMFNHIGNRHAVKCALIAVDEMIKLYNEMNELGLLKENSIGFELVELKQEIEKL
jgi:hypothetical protein